MGKRLNGLMVGTGPEYYYEQGFRDVIESHMHLLRANASTVPVETGAGYRHEFDLNAFLRESGYQPHMYWVIMRVNDWTSPIGIGETTNEILVPNETLLADIARLYLTNNT